MYYRGYGDVGDGYEMGPKRQRLFDQGSSFYEFFHGLEVVDVLFVRKNGKLTGEAFCVLAYSLQVDYALQRNRQNMGRRYVEVFRCKRQDYYKAIANEVSDSRGGSPPHRSVSKAKSSDNRADSAEHTGVLRMRGLPFSAGKDDIMDFFKDFVLSEDLVHVILNSEGRATGEAIVEFASAEDSKAAMAKDRKRLGNRYIELFPSSHEELDAAVSKGGLSGSSKPKSSDDGKDSDEHTGVLRLRGLPFSAGKDDILDFFKDFALSEDSITFTFTFGGRPTGEAFVEFASAEDSKAAMVKDRMSLGSRYIELFPSSLEELNEAVSRARPISGYPHCSGGEGLIQLVVVCMVKLDTGSLAIPPFPGLLRIALGPLPGLYGSEGRSLTASNVNLKKTLGLITSDNGPNCVIKVVKNESWGL
ncbi:hypothetical protein Vadar_009646 [Vaccinium darrowii]|uniref:Uncharacterized protein n=1 Tax=Vaccinium darrowii TaxID=229202 RepID=A0ACB7X979_9ERIC|nr:hypothetical protein Vadar_009646 [Vaccinium darrowii]